MQGIGRIRQFNFSGQIIACHACKTKNPIKQARVRSINVCLSPVTTNLLSN
jgi:hypothetical protein